MYVSLTIMYCAVRNGDHLTTLRHQERFEHFDRKVKKCALSFA